MSKLISFIGIIFLAVFILGFEKSDQLNLHPNEGEILSFNYTNYDAGLQSVTASGTVYFPFVNNSGHDITIKNIVCNNDYNSKPYSVNYTYSVDYKTSGVLIKNGQRDSIAFYRTYSRDMREGLFDNSWTINFEGTETKQYLNIFCELEYTSGKLVTESIVLPPANRGDTIRFETAVKNTGGATTTVLNIDSWASHNIKPVDKYPIKIEPDETKFLGFELSTDNLYNEYVGQIVFDTDEVGYYTW